MTTVHQCSAIDLINTLSIRTTQNLKYIQKRVYMETLMDDPIRGCAEINLHDPSLLPTLQWTLQCMGHAQMCITCTQTFPLCKLGGWSNAQTWCSGNRSVMGNRGTWWTFKNWGNIGLSPGSRETTLTYKPAKNYTKMGSQSISNNSLKEKEET